MTCSIENAPLPRLVRGTIPCPIWKRRRQTTRLCWLLDDAVRSTFTLPGLFLDDAFRNVALAAAFTGFVTTAGNRVGETVALGKLSSSEASVLLATEPLWAAVFASFLLHEQLGLWDGVGGALIVAACVATAIDPKWLRETLGIAAAGGETIGAEPEK